MEEDDSEYTRSWIHRRKNPELLTAQDLNLAMYYLMYHKRSPREAKYEMRRWAAPYADCEMINIVNGAARRLGLGPNEAFRDKDRRDR